MAVSDFSEYNNIHLPRADHLVCFLKNLPHAIEKAGSKEVQREIWHQLQCIGYSDQFVSDMAQVAHDYKEHHKKRIRAEQMANDPAVRYPHIKDDRRAQFEKNCKLFVRIHQHGEYNNMCMAIEDAINESASCNSASKVLEAYLAQDVDAMVSAICKYTMEDIFAQAKIIPDTQELFYKHGDCAGEIVFPLWGKESISVEEFKEYILTNYNIHDDTWKLIQSAIRFAATAKTQEAKQDCLWTLLKDSIGIPEEVVRMIDFGKEEQA